MSLEGDTLPYVELRFASSNWSKFSDANRVLGELNILVNLFKCKLGAIQSDSLRSIVEAKASVALARCNEPVLVEHSGLFIKALNGFPGPYFSYVMRTIDNYGLLNMLERTSQHSAVYSSAVAFASPGNET